MAKKGAGAAEAIGRNPTDRGKCGTRRHRLTDGAGVPLAVVITGANRHDMKQRADLLDAQAYVRPPAQGEMRHRCLDRGYDDDACRAVAEARGYTPHLPPKPSDGSPLPPPGHPDRHPPRRRVVAVAHSWVNRFRRLLSRWEQYSANYPAFVQLAASLIIYRKLRQVRTLSG